MELAALQKYVEEAFADRVGETAVDRTGLRYVLRELTRAIVNGMPQDARLAWVATTAPITASGLQSIDGVSVLAGWPVLRKDEADQTINGVWIASAGAWTRATWLTGLVSPGVLVPVLMGALNHDRVWMLTTDPTAPSTQIQVGAAALVFSEFGGGGAGGGGAVADVVPINAAVPIGAPAYADSGGVFQMASAAAGGGQTPDADVIVLAKPTPTTANVAPSGLTGSIFTGLTPGALYFVSTVAGAIVTPAPTAPGTKQQKVGRAISATRLLVDVEPSILLS